MKKKILYIGLLLIGAIVMLGIYGQSTDTTPISEWTIQKGTASLSGTIPNNWIQDNEFNTSVDAFFFSPNQGTEDPFRENINIKTEDLTGYVLTSKEYTDISLENFKKAVGDNSMSIVDRKDINIDIASAVQISHITTLPENIPLRFEQVFLVIDTTGYTITFTALPDGSEEFITQFDTFISNLHISPSRA